MVFNCETIRKTTYLVAGILPATFFGILSLFLIVTPALLWTVAAWIGIAGLVMAFNRRPYDEIHTNAVLMLIIGVAAMAPVAVFLLLGAPNRFEWHKDYAFALFILGTVGPILVALHFLYFQSILLMASWLSLLITNQNSDRVWKPTGAARPANA